MVFCRRFNGGNRFRDVSRAFQKCSGWFERDNGRAPAMGPRSPRSFDGASLPPSPPGEHPGELEARQPAPALGGPGGPGLDGNLANLVNLYGWATLGVRGPCTSSQQKEPWFEPSALRGSVLI